MQDGKAYEGNQQYAGQGVVKWCAFCQKHRPVGGQKKTPRGWKCKSCQEKQ